VQPIRNEPPKKEEPKFNVVVQVTTGSATQFDVSLGECNEEEIQHINSVVMNALKVIHENEDLVLADKDGHTYHFNLRRLDAAVVRVG
jgi:hypothetical protein